MKAHSKFSASGAERWFNCSASVALSEGQPDKESVWAKEGTEAHAILEIFMRNAIDGGQRAVSAPSEMFQHAKKAAQFMLGVGGALGAEVMVETRIYLKFIHEEMFGTFDGAILDHFGTLHVFDFKYGAGHAVSPKDNLQMIFYALGLAYKYQWNFKTVKLWIIQPRIKGYSGPVYWEISIEVLRSYVPKFQEAVWRVENDPKFKEGAWCHWCKAKSICPLKVETKKEKAREIFSANPIGGENGKKEKEKEKEYRFTKDEVEKEFKEKITETQKACREARGESVDDFY